MMKRNSSYMIKRNSSHDEMKSINRTKETHYLAQNSKGKKDLAYHDLNQHSWGEEANIKFIIFFVFDTIPLFWYKKPDATVNRNNQVLAVKTLYFL